MLVRGHCHILTFTKKSGPLKGPLFLLIKNEKIVIDYLSWEIIVALKLRRTNSTLADKSPAFNLSASSGWDILISSQVGNSLLIVNTVRAYSPEPSDYI